MLSHEELLRILVGFDTTSERSNQPLIDFIRNYLDDLGIESEIVPGDETGKTCLWATLGPHEEAGPVLAGHTDTVPTAGQAWSSDPFTLTERDDRLHGRGACDMKAFIACVLASLPAFLKQTARIPIHLAFTHDEETNMAGARRLTDHLRQKGIKPNWVWIGEPTDLALIDQHKGTAYFETKIRGVPGHSSKPDQGLNAIDLGVQFVSILKAIETDRKSKPWPQSPFDPPYSTFNTGMIEGGTAENIIAEHCRIVWQTRTHPGDDLDATLGEIERTATREIAPRFAAFAPRAGMSTCACSRTPALLPTKVNPGRDLLQRLTGTEKTAAVSFGTEGGYYQGLGAPVIICGPGSIDQAHKADEFVSRAQLKACMTLLEKALPEATKSP